VWLTGFLVVVVNVAVAALLAARRSRRIPGIRGIRTGLAAAAVLALAVGPVWARLRPPPAATGSVRVAVVQPGLFAHGGPRLAAETALTNSLRGRHAQLVVWGESSVAFDLDTRPEIRGALVALARQSGADLLVNVDARRASGEVFKSSELVTPAGLAGRYVKTRLVPFGEYIPLRPLLGWLTDVSRAAQQNRGRGHGAVMLHASALTFGPLICFESTFPDMSRRTVELGADLVVYQSATSTFQGSWEQPQHASLAAVRAVETGRPVVQTALTGTSAAFDATGHRLLWLAPSFRGAASVAVETTGGRTPYDVAGDWLLPVCAGVIAAGLIAASLQATASRPERA
jgi:apolipoprotein N-acyltransferase